jgi:hypothetical protein
MLEKGLSRETILSAFQPGLKRSAEIQNLKEEMVDVAKAAFSNYSNSIFMNNEEKKKMKESIEPPMSVG